MAVIEFIVFVEFIKLIQYLFPNPDKPEPNKLKQPICL